MDSALWYRQPVTEWDQAMPIGNGRLGGMIFGGTATERIQLNENSLWAGGPRTWDNPRSFSHLAEVRALLTAGRPVEAMALADRHLMAEPLRLSPYQPLGDALLGFAGHERADAYRRELDLDQAIVTVSYRVDGVAFRREYFASAVDEVLVVRLTADRPGAISFTAELRREQDATVTVLDDRAVLDGRCDGGHGLAFRGELLVRAEGGTVSARDGRVEVTGADAATVLIAGATAFRAADPAAQCAQRLQAAAARTVVELRERHLAEHRRLFRRVAFELAHDPALDALPTDERLRRVQDGAVDQGLEALYFNFGRYLLISSSRRGSLPANLQGLWNDSMSPPWNSDYHLNINIQMNYWLAETGNLAECHEPLFDLLESLRAPGRATARTHYGCRGFVAHHITDLWGFTAPGDGACWGLWPMGAGWLCLHLWEHWAFGGDRAFLARAYPTMKEAAEFFLDYLVEDADGHLVAGPSISPENRYRLPNGNVGVLCMGASMDTQIITALFSRCIDAAGILDVDADFRTTAAAALRRLPAPRIGSLGQLQEWAVDYEEPDPGHRHISHLFALHPDGAITPRTTPELAAAARTTLERRLAHGGGHTGWSRAWIINFWTRLQDGEQAHQHLLALLRKATLPNLFDLHPPFQIDGNFGAAAAMAEMLVQSHAGEIALLPALPRAWASGRVRGLRARGGCEIDLAWSADGAPTATLRATRASAIRLRPPPGRRFARVMNRSAPVVVALDGDGVATWTADAGTAYDVVFA